MSCPTDHRDAATSSDRLFTVPFLIASATNFLLYVNYYVIMVVMASYATDVLEADIGTAGFTASVFLVGALAARFVSAAVVDRLGCERALRLSAVGIVACSALYLAGPGTAPLIALRALHGFFYGIAQTAVTSLVTDLIPRNRKGEGLGYYMLSTALGSAIGPFVGSALMHGAGYDASFLACLGVIVAGCASAFALRDAKAAEGEAPQGRGSLGGGVTAKPELPEPTSTASAPSPSADGPAAATTPAPSLSPSPAAARKLSFRGVVGTFVEFRALPVSCVAGIVYLAYGTIITYLNSFAAEVDLTVASSLFFVVYSAAMFACRPFTGRRFDRKGDLGVMMFGFVAFGAGMALIGLAQSTAVLLAAAVLAGFGIGALQPCGLALAVQRAPESRVTAANATYFMLLDVAVGVCPMLLGWVVPAFGYRALYLAMVGVVAVAALIFLVLRKAGKVTNSQQFHATMSSTR